MNLHSVLPMTSAFMKAVRAGASTSSAQRALRVSKGEFRVGLRPFMVTRAILTLALRADFVVRARSCTRSRYLSTNGWEGCARNEMRILVGKEART